MRTDIDFNVDDPALHPDPTKFSKGYMARNYDACPEGSLAFASPFPDDQLVPMSEVLDRIREKEKYEATPIHTHRRLVERGKVSPVLNQNGIGYCHAFSPTVMIRMLRAMQNLEDVELSASSIGGPVTNFTNSGAYIFNDLQHIARYGVCPVNYGGEVIYPMTTTKNHWTPTAKQLASKSICEEYWEGTNRNDHQALSCLLTDKPVCGGWNWWGHAVTLFWVTYHEASRTLYYIGENSWSETWSYGLEQFPQYADLKGFFIFPVGTVDASGKIKLGKYGKYCGTPDEWYAGRSVKSSQISLV